MDNQLGLIFRKARRKKSWTVNRLLVELESLNVTCSPSYITNIETHKEIPRPEVVVSISKALGIDPLLMLDIAKRSKIKEFEEKIEMRYKIDNK